MDLGLKGRVALVTGASQGIGRAIAAELAAEGAEVAISSRTQEKIEATASEIGAVGFVHDVADLDRAPMLVSAVEQQLGPIDVLVTNSGGPAPGMPLEMPREQWEAAYRELVLGSLTLVEAVMPGMRSRRFGRILAVSSTTVREPIQPLILSNTHRTGLLAAFKTIATHVAGDGVTLNTILPGRIDTERLLSLYGSRENLDQMAEAEIPARRLGTVEEMAAAAAFLCSERAGYITGSSLAVDGGLLRSM